MIWYARSRGTGQQWLTDREEAYKAVQRSPERYVCGPMYAVADRDAWAIEDPEVGYVEVTGQEIAQGDTSVLKWVPIERVALQALMADTTIGVTLEELFADDEGDA